MSANPELTGDPAAPYTAPTTQGWLDSQLSLPIDPPAQTSSSATSQQAAEIPNPNSSQPQLHTSPPLTLTDEVNPETHRSITRTLAQAGAIRRLLGDSAFEKRIFNFLLVELMDSYHEAVELMDWRYNIWHYYPDNGTHRTRSLRNVGEAIGKVSYVSWDVGEARLRYRISVLETLFDDMAESDKVVFAQENAISLLQRAMMQQRRQGSPGSDSDGESDGSGNGSGNGHWGTNGSGNGGGAGILSLLGLPPD